MLALPLVPNDLYRPISCVNTKIYVLPIADLLCVCMCWIPSAGWGVQAVEDLVKF